MVEPALFCAPAAVALARLCGAKAWLHVQDFEVDAAFSMGLLRGARIRRLVTPAPTWPRWCKPAAWWSPPENAAALAQAIQTLAADPALRQNLGAAGYLYAQAHLDSEAVLGRFESDLHEVVGI